MEEEECIHGIWPESVCSICNGKDQKASDEEGWKVFPAKYGGECSGCDEPIQEGDMIAWRQGFPIFHEDCAP